MLKFKCSYWLKKSHVTIFSQSKCLDYSVPKIYAVTFFIGQGPGISELKDILIFLDMSKSFWAFGGFFVLISYSDLKMALIFFWKSWKKFWLKP